MEYTNKHGYDFSKLTLGTVQLGMHYGISNVHGKPSSGVAGEIDQFSIEIYYLDCLHTIMRDPDLVPVVQSHSIGEVTLAIFRVMLRQLRQHFTYACSNSGRFEWNTNDSIPVALRNK